ncbi:MAG: hypothetical protein V7K26_17345 [Nostoc sp.]
MVSWRNNKDFSRWFGTNTSVNLRSPPAHGGYAIAAELIDNRITRTADYKRIPANSIHWLK